MKNAGQDFDIPTFEFFADTKIFMFTSLHRKFINIKKSKIHVSKHKKNI